MAAQARLTAAIRVAGIRDPHVLEAFRTIPREGFVPTQLAGRAYEDVPLPIPHGQVTTQPSVIAKMIEALDLRGDERVLEIGTGYGFQTALLASLAREVWSVERFGDIAEIARRNLRSHGIDNAHVVKFVEDAGRLVAREILTAAHFVRLVGEHGFSPT